MASNCVYDYFGQYVPDARAQAAMLYGAFLEAGTVCGPFPDQIGGGPGRGPFQIEAGPGGSRTGLISEPDARRAGPSVQHMAAEYLSCAQSVPNSGDPMLDYAGIVHCAEKGPMYPANRLQEAWNQLSSFDPGNAGTGAGGNSWWEKVKNALGTAGSLANPFDNATRVPGPVQAITAPIAALGWVVNSIRNGTFWVRVLLIIGGAAFVLIGVSKLAGVSAVPVPVPA